MQEYRAEKAMQALMQMAAPIVRVCRNGQVMEIEARELVPGDVDLLEAGSAIPDDARLIETASLRATEASLTGEAHAIDKSKKPSKATTCPLLTAATGKNPLKYRIGFSLLPPETQGMLSGQLPAW